MKKLKGFIMNRTNTLHDRNYEFDRFMTFIKFMSEEGILILFAENEIAESLKVYRKGDVINLEVDFKTSFKYGNFETYKINKIYFANE